MFNGVFSCEGSEIITLIMCKYKRSVVTMISFILLIACAPASDANEVIRTVESPRLVVGSRITMSCTYLGSCPDPCNWVEVIWEKIGQSGSVMTRRNESSARGDDDRWSVATEFPKTTLAITKVNASDSGSYQCCFLMRSNPEKRVEAQLPLTIVTSSFLEMFDEDVYLTVGEEDPVLPTVVDCIDTTDIRKKSPPLRLQNLFPRLRAEVSPRSTEPVPRSRCVWD